MTRPRRSSNKYFAKVAAWCELPRAASSALVRSAAAEGVRLAAGPLFAPEGGLERFVRLPYTRSPEQLAEATERLARAWQETQPQRRTTRRAAPALVT